MVGTAVYQVTWWASTVDQKSKALNLDGTTTTPPENMVARVDATKP